VCFEGLQGAIPLFGVRTKKIMFMGLQGAIPRKCCVCGTSNEGRQPGRNRNHFLNLEDYNMTPQAA
jgi:hypothetical protein